MTAASEARRVVKRLVVELNQRSSDALDRRCAVESLNKTTVTNRAIQVYDRLQAHAEADGSIQLVHADGRVETVVIV